MNKAIFNPKLAKETTIFLAPYMVIKRVYVLT